MNNLKALVIAISLLSATIFITQSAFASDKSTITSNASLTKSVNTKELISFVESAVAYAKANGKEKALNEFSNKTGSFVRGDLYIYAYDFNGTCLAHPFKPDSLGKDTLNDSDLNGVLYPRNLIRIAREGKGFSYKVFPNPAHDNKDELKLCYVIKVNDNWWLGSGLYLSNISTSFDQKERNDLVAYVEVALQFAKENGKPKALEVFNDPKGNFSRDYRYIFAAEYGGECLAQPFQPDLIGKNRLDEKDPNGVKISRQAWNTARKGNGFYYAIYPDPSRNMTKKLKLNYVTDVDGTWWLAAGIYAM